MPVEITTDVRVAELDRQIREKYKRINADHVSLLVDLYMLVYRNTSRGRTYIDALDLIGVIERNLKKMDNKADA